MADEFFENYRLVPDDSNTTGNETPMFAYYYDEEGTDSFTPKELQKLVSVTVCYGLIFLLGITGNALVIYCVAKYKRMQTITNQLLLSLACADLLLTIICLPIKCAKLFSYSWIFGSVMCLVTHYIQTWSMVTSVMTLTAISLERYYAISRPLRAKYICTTNHARAVILTIWIAASVFSLPIVFVQKHQRIGLTEPPVFWCVKQNWENEQTKMLVIGYEIYMLFLLFFTPVIVMAFAYGGVCIELWAATKDIPRSRTPLRKKQSVEGQPCIHENTIPVDASDTQTLNKTHNKDAQVRRQVLKMLFMVVAIFILCWCPLLSYNLVVAVGAIDPFKPQIYPYADGMNTTFSLLAYSNSCLNPIVYGFMSRYFRKSFKQAISSCCLLSHRNNTDYLNKPYTQRDRSSSSLRKPGEQRYVTDCAKRNTITTTTADSTLSRSPPISPNNTYPRA